MSQYIYAFCLTRFCFILFVLNISNLCEIKFLRFIDSIAALPLAQHCDLSFETRERETGRSVRILCNWQMSNWKKKMIYDDKDEQPSPVAQIISCMS